MKPVCASCFLRKLSNKRACYKSNSMLALIRCLEDLMLVAVRESVVLLQNWTPSSDDGYPAVHVAQAFTRKAEMLHRNIDFCLLDARFGAMWVSRSILTRCETM
jgi:hypothetical protein